MSRGVVLVRTDEPALQLQALRTLLSLSLGDRQADLLVAAPGLAVLSPPSNSEAAHCLDTLRKVGLAIHLDVEAVHARADPGAEALSHAEFVGRLATADFVQVF